MEANYNAKWRARALTGEAAAVDRLAEEALDPLYRFCFYRVGRNRHMCEEVVQETLIKALGQLAQYDPARSGDNIFPWLSGLARNEIHRALSKHPATASLEMLWNKMDERLRAVFTQLDSEPFSDEVLAREETREMVNATMSQIPSHYRDALEQKYILGRSVRDIAAALRTTEKAIESQLVRARRAFRATFVALTENLETAEGGGA